MIVSFFFLTVKVEWNVIDLKEGSFYRVVWVMEVCLEFEFVFALYFHNGNGGCKILIELIPINADNRLITVRRRKIDRKTNRIVQVGTFSITVR